MAKFNPQTNDTIVIDGESYIVAPHPAVPAMAFGQEGRKATVYQLKQNRNSFALKIFKRPFREDRLVDTCDVLSTLQLDGLEVCNRQCFTHQSYGPLLQQYPEMEYAILMPWMDGSTWFDIVFANKQINEDSSKKIAKSTADVLATLEGQGFAHCDVAGANVMVDTDSGDVSLIDVEDMYGPNLQLTDAFPRGTDGYQHQQSRALQQGQWCLEGDRFAGAVLLAEMLTWHNQEIRRNAGEEHFFPVSELQNPACTNYQLMVDVLNDLSSGIADCFQKAWEAKSLSDCPPMTEWAKLLEFPLVSEWLSISATAPAASYTPGGWTPIDVSPEESFTWDPLPISSTASSLLAAPTFSWFTGPILRWAEIQGAEGYIVEQADNTNFTNPQEVYRGNQTAWDSANSQSTGTFYRICAYKGQTRSEWHNVSVGG